MAVQSDPRLVDVVTPVARAEAYVRAGLWDDSRLADRVALHARTAPDRVAVVDRLGGRRRTYAQLHDDVEALARQMVAVGVVSGDVVSVQLPNCYEGVVVAVAVQLLGGVINPLLTTYRSHEVAHVYRTARPALHFSPAAAGTVDFRRLAAEAANAGGCEVAHVPLDLSGDGRVVDWLADTPALPSRRPDGATPDTRPAAQKVSELIFTSGTEATPKAVMHTEATANFSVRAARARLGVGPDDTVWMPSPIGHSTGFNYGVRFALYHGPKLVLQDAWDADAAMDLVTRERCSYTLAATTFLHDLVRAAEAADVRLPSLRYFGCGGATVPAALVASAAERGISVLRLYGATEFLVATWNTNDAPVDRRVDTDGAAIPGVDVRVVDEEGDAPAPGQPGEVVVRGPNTCVGFFADPQRTGATIDDAGWCRSGDLATIDDLGYLTVVGRKKDMIIRGGINIAPREIEDALLGFDEVRQAAVVGIPDERLGERTCACLVLEPGRSIDLETLTGRLLGNGFAKFKLPEVLEIFDRFPMTASGKIQKHELRQRIGVGHG